MSVSISEPAREISIIVIVVIAVLVIAVVVVVQHPYCNGGKVRTWTINTESIAAESEELASCPLNDAW